MTLATLACSVTGAALFWLPMVVTQAIRRESYSSPDVLLITIIIPVITVGAFLVLRRRITILKPIWIAIQMALGVWVSGPLVMATNHMLEGGSPDLRMTVIATILFPVFTFIYGTYSGTLLALFITTPLLIVLGARKKKATTAFEHTRTA